MTGHPKLITPYNGTQFHEMVDALTKHHGEMSIEVGTIAVDLRKLLANPTGTKFAIARADLRVKAMMVARPLAHASSLNAAAVKAYRSAYLTYLNLYTTASKSGSRGRQFDVSG